MNKKDDIIEGKLVAEPDTIDFNGTIYCKVKDILIDLYKYPQQRREYERERFIRNNLVRKYEVLLKNG